MKNLMLELFDVKHGAIDNNCSCDCNCNCLQPSYENEFNRTFTETICILSSCNEGSSWVDEVKISSTGKVIAAGRLIDVAEFMLTEARKALR